MKVGIEQLILSPDRADRRIPEVSLALTHQVAEYGQIEPVVVRPTGGSKYEILSNAETWLAVQRAGLHSVEIVVHDDLSDDEALQIINGAGELDPITEAEWFESQLNGVGGNGRYKSIAALARSVGRTRSYVSHSLRFLTLGETLKEALRSGALSTGHAKVLLSVRNSDQRLGFATRAIRERWSIRKLKLATESLGRIKAKREGLVEKSPDVIALERKLTGLIGSPVEIDEQGGKLSIGYGKNLEVLDGILKRLGYTG